MVYQPPTTTIVNLPFTGGMDEKSASIYLDPEKRVAAISNGMFTKIGQVNKRYGLRYLGNTILPNNLLTDAFTVATRVHYTKKSGLMAFSDQDVYNYSTAKNALACVGKVPNVYVTRRGIPGSSGSFAPNLVDFSTSLRMAVYLGSYAGSFKLTSTIYDRDTGEVIQQPLQLDPVVVNSIVGAFINSLGTKIFIVYMTASDHRFTIYDLASGNYSAATVIAGTAANYMDACPFIGDPGGGFLVVFNPVATTNLLYRYYDASGTNTSGTIVVQTANTLFTNIEICGTYGASELIWISYGRTNGANHEWCIQTYLGDGTWAVNAAVAVLHSVANTIGFQLTPICRLDPTHAWGGILFTMSGIPSGLVAQWGLQSRFTANAVSNVKAQFPMGLYPVGKPVVDVDSSVIMPCAFALYAYNSSSAQAGQHTLYLMRFAASYHDGALPIATVAPRVLDESYMGSVASLGRYPFMSCGGTNTLPTRAAVGLQIRSPNTSSFADYSNAAYQGEFFFNQDLSFDCHELGDGVHIQASVPMFYDGNAVFERSFFYYPEGSYATQSGAGGALAGNYGYAIVYRRIDAAGDVHQSAPFFLPLINVTGGQKVTLTIPLLSMTYANQVKNAPVYADIYRTITAGGTYYLLGSVDATNPGTVISTQANLFTTYGPDTQSDANLQISTLLYTTGNVLDGVNPPAARCETVHKNRLWMVDESGQTVWFTQKYTPGLAPYFQEALTFPVSEGGDITALQSLDDRLIIYKGDSIWVVTGDGPAITGTGSDLSEPFRISSDMGATDWRSVVQIPRGHLFRGQGGISLLDRGGQLTDIGKSVQTTLGTQTITSATLCPVPQHVRFSLQGSAQVIVYDYQLDQWTTLNYAHVGSSIASTTLVSGYYMVASTGGLLFVERAPTDPTPWYDADSVGGTYFVPTSVTMPWLAVNGKQGSQRLSHISYLGERPDDHGITMGIAVNYDPTIKQTVTWDSARLSANPAGIVQVSMRPLGNYAKGQSVQITMTDTPGAAMVTGQGAVFTNLAVEIQVIGNRYQRLPNGVRQ